MVAPLLALVHLHLIQGVLGFRPAADRAEIYQAVLVGLFLLGLLARLDPAELFYGFRVGEFRAWSRGPGICDVVMREELDPGEGRIIGREGRQPDLGRCAAFDGFRVHDAEDLRSLKGVFILQDHLED